MLNSTEASLAVFRDAMDNAKDSAEALRSAEEQLADEIGGLTAAVRVSAAEVADAEYSESGQARRDLGLVGAFNPAAARAFAESEEGGGLLERSRAILGAGPLGDKISGVLDGLPGTIGKNIKTGLDQVGGISGGIAAGVSMLGEALPSVLSSVGLGDSTVGAGLGGALAEGGSRAVSMATIGTQLAGPLGGAIGLITGALSGAIDGYFNASRSKQLENSLSNLSISTQKANEALDNLANVDNEQNYQAAAKATDTLRDSIKDLAV